ncbi:MAG: phenylalanine--tRNA ligase subunit beta [Rhodospirillales bacterium]|nr:MAG: phenylalanine--tRNA ligase subunit beta [Rhodospirillales bacterium]
MKFTLSWLKDHLETDASLGEITDALTALGLEVEGVHDPAKDLAAFTVGYVVEAKKHPNADKLSLCIVDTGTEKVQVVCGAPNARTGMKGVFAPAGTYIPGTGLDLKKGVIRGEESNGMLCSEREMGLSDEHQGIIELPEDAPVGAPFAKIMGLDDPVIEIGITPNRGDCLGVRGIARDLAAAGIGTLKDFATAEPVPPAFESPIQWRREFPKGQDDACPMVVGRYFRNLTNGPSPAWMQHRLLAIGLRPISALVDITNYVTFDLGRPLHVFDAAKLEGGTLTMRFAKTGETILALDGKEYELEEGMTCIADARGVHGIAGVMGGEVTGCTAETTEMFLEVALFDPIRTAATGRRLGIESDARYRFERTVDPESALWGAEVAAHLVLDICGGEASDLSIAGEMPDTAREVTLRADRVKTLGGVDLPVKAQRQILEALGFATKESKGAIVATTPSWRPDITIEPCLVEEVLRVKGFDAIPAVPLERESDLPEQILTLGQRRESFARRVLAGRGLLEAVTWSFMAEDQAALFGGVPAQLHLENPISADLAVMRPSILANLVAAAARNTDRGYPDLGLFEVGPAWRDDTPEGEDIVAAGLRAGNSGPRHWAAASRAVDAFDAKADALAVLAACGAPVDNLQVTRDAPDWYHPGRSGTLRLGPNVLARFGEIHPRVLRAMGMKGPAAGFEIFLHHIPQPRAKGGKTRALLRPSPFQPVGRDFAFVVDAEVPAEALIRAARGADKTLISEVSLFDVYEGEGVAEGKKSVAVAITLQPREKTLTDEEIERVSAAVIAAVEKQTGGVLRA